LRYAHHAIDLPIDAQGTAPVSEAGRPLEVEPLIGSFLELGVLTDTPMPATTAVDILVSLLDARLRDR